MSEQRDIFLRAHIVKVCEGEKLDDKLSPRHKRAGIPEKWPEYCLIFDTETRTTVDQKLTFLIYRGHLLLGTNSHSDAGIMQPRWESNQFRQLMIGNLVFTTEQSKLMQEQARTRMRLPMGNSDPGFISRADK